MSEFNSEIVIAQTEFMQFFKSVGKCFHLVSITFLIQHICHTFSYIYLMPPITSTPSGFVPDKKNLLLLCTKIPTINK